jgi:hypothetical protein
MAKLIDPSVRHAAATIGQAMLIQFMTDDPGAAQRYDLVPSDV